MDGLQLMLTQREARLPKIWIWVTIFYSFILPILLFFLIVIFFDSISKIDPKLPGEGGANQIISLFFGAISFPFYYYCVYKKPGTILIAITIYLAALYFILFFFIDRSADGLIMTLPWYYLTYRMWTINIKRAHLQYLQSPRYQEVLQNFRGASNLKELKLKQTEVQLASGGDCFVEAAYKSRKYEIKNP